MNSELRELQAQNLELEMYIEFTTCNTKHSMWNFKGWLLTMELATQYAWIKLQKKCNGTQKFRGVNQKNA